MGPAGLLDQIDAVEQWVLFTLAVNVGNGGGGSSRVNLAKMLFYCHQTYR